MTEHGSEMCFVVQWVMFMIAICSGELSQLTNEHLRELIAIIRLFLVYE